MFKFFLSAVLPLTAVLFLSGGCSGNQKTNGEEEGKAQSGSRGEFPSVTVPDMLVSRRDAMIYLSENYWNRFLDAARIEGSEKNGPAETAEIKSTRLSGLEKTEGSRNESKEKGLSSAVLGVDSVRFDRAFAQYIVLLSAVEKYFPADSGSVRKSVGKLMRAADSLYGQGEKKFLLRLMDLSEKFLYHPASPALNEELYIPFVENILALKSLDSLSKLAYVYQSKMVHLNRVGTRANDFEYAEMINGEIRRSRLYDIKAEYVLLYFNNPDCSSCAAVTKKLTEASLPGRMVDQGRMKIIVLYTDQDPELWKQHAKDYPEGWIYAYDPLQVLRNNELYGLRAIPSLYLLDKDKKVILKDAGPEALLKKLAAASPSNFI